MMALLIAVSLWFGVKAGGGGLLRNEHAPNGIVSLELAGSAEAAAKIVKSWNRPAPYEKSEETDEEVKSTLLDVARESIIYDYFFILFYTVTLALGCLISADIIDARHETLKRLGMVRIGWALIYAQVLVAAMDATENVALWNMLQGSGASFWPTLARWCAMIKFGLIATSLLYMLLVFIIWIGESYKRRPFAVMTGQRLGGPPRIK